MFHFSKWIRTSAQEIRAAGAGFTKGFIRQTQTPGFSQLRGFDPAPRKTHSSQNWRTDALQRDFYGPGLSQPWEDQQRCSVWWLSQLHLILVGESRKMRKPQWGLLPAQGLQIQGVYLGPWTHPAAQSCTGMGCLEVTRARMSLSCDTEPVNCPVTQSQSMLSAGKWSQQVTTLAVK